MQVRFLSFILSMLIAMDARAQMMSAQMGVQAGMPQMMMGGMNGMGGPGWGSGAYGAQNCAYDQRIAPGAIEDSDRLLSAKRSLAKTKKDQAKEEARKRKLEAQLKKTRSTINAVLTGPASNLVFNHMNKGLNRSSEEYSEACGTAGSTGTSSQPGVAPDANKTPADTQRAVQPIDNTSNAKPSNRMPASGGDVEFYCMKSSKKNLGQAGYQNLWSKYAQDGGAVDSSICYEAYSGITKASASSDKRSDCASAMDEYLQTNAELVEAAANIRMLKDEAKGYDKLISAETDRLEADVEGDIEGDCRECRVLSRQSRYKPSGWEVAGGIFSALAGAGLTAWGMQQSAYYNAKAGYPTNPLMVAMPGLGLLTSGVYGAINGGMGAGAIGCAGGGPFGGGGGQGGPFGAPSVLPMMNGGAMMPGAMNSPFGNPMMNPMMYGGGMPGMGGMYGGGMPGMGGMYGGGMPGMGGMYGGGMPGMGGMYGGAPLINGMHPMMGVGMGMPGLTGNPMMNPLYLGGMMPGMPYGGMNPMMGGQMGMMNPMMGMNPMMNMMNPYAMNPMMMGGMPYGGMPYGGAMTGGPGMGGMYGGMPGMGGMYGSPYGGMQMQMQMQMQQMQQQQMYAQQMYQTQMYKQAAVSQIQQQIYSLQMQMYQISSGTGPSILPYPGPGGPGMSAYGAMGAGLGTGPAVLPYPSPYGR